MPPTDAPASPAPAVTDNTGDRAIAVVPSPSDELAAGNVPGLGVDNPPTTDFAKANQSLIDKNVLNDVQFYDSSAVGTDTGSNTGKPPEGKNVDGNKDANNRDSRNSDANNRDANKDSGNKDSGSNEISTERRQQIDSLKGRLGGDAVEALNPQEKDKFFNNAIDAAQKLNGTSRDDLGKSFDATLNSVPPEQRESFNKAIGMALHDQGSNLRTANEPPVGLLIEKKSDGTSEIVGRSAIVDDPKEFKADQAGLETAPKLAKAFDKAYSDIPPEKVATAEKDFSATLGSLERANLFAPMKDIGARERPSNLPNENVQANNLKKQLRPGTASDEAVKTAVEAANKIAFAKPEDINKLWNQSFEDLRKAGVKPDATTNMMERALKNISKDFNTFGTSGGQGEVLLSDSRLKTSANPAGVVGTADSLGRTPDTPEHKSNYDKALEIGASLRAANTEVLGRNSTRDAVNTNVDKAFSFQKYFRR